MREPCRASAESSATASSRRGALRKAIVMSKEDSYPFVSPRSPSYERARREWRHHASTAHPQVIALLARLSEAEQNAVQAYSTVEPALQDTSFASVVRDRRALHQARREALSNLIEALGGSA